MNRLANRLDVQMITHFPKTFPPQPKRHCASDKTETKVKVAQADIQNEEEPSDSVLTRICLIKGVKLFKHLYYTPEDEDNSTGFITLDELLRDTIFYTKQRIISKFNTAYEVLRETIS